MSLVFYVTTSCNTSKFPKSQYLHMSEALNIGVMEGEKVSSILEGDNS